MKLTSFEGLARLCRRRFKWVPIPVGKRWGFTVYDLVRIRSLTEHEMSVAECAIMTKAGGIDVDALINAKQLLISWCVVDENGAQVFDTPEKVEALGPMDGRAAKVLWEACRDHCGYQDVDINELLQVAQLLNTTQGMNGDTEAEKIGEWMSYDRRN